MAAAPGPGPVVTGELEQVTDALCYHGEGPVWSPTWGGLRWVDLLAGDVLTLRPDGSVDRMHVGDVAAFVRPRTTGGWVVATERGLARADEADGIPTPWFDLWDDPSVRMNEGGVDGEGRLWAGTMGYDRVPGSARLHRVDATGHVTTSRENLDDPEPQAGAVFRVRVAVPGLPVRAFTG